MVRISSLDALDCWYGFIYTNNQSQYNLRESLSLELEGLELIHTDGKTYRSEATKGEIELEIASKDDHVIIMRRTQGKCTYSLSRITHERDYDDHEYIDMAIN